MSELYVELYSDAPFVDARDVGVCQTPYIVDTQDSEDVFDTEGYLHVGGGGHIVLLLVAVREIEQCSGIEWIGAVLVAQVAGLIPRRSSRWRVYRDSSRTRGIRGDT